MYRKSNRRKKYEGKVNRLRANQRAAKERLRLERCQGEPIRESLPVIALRLTVEQPFRGMEVYELRRKDDEHSLCHAFCNGHWMRGDWSKSKLFRHVERQTYSPGKMRRE
jgi:hypothetical protein